MFRTQHHKSVQGAENEMDHNDKGRSPRCISTP